MVKTANKTLPKAPEITPELIENLENAQKKERKPIRFNKFKLGRRSKYKKEYCQKIIEYFTQPLYTERVKSRVTSKSGNITEHLEAVGNPPRWFGAFAYDICHTTQGILLDWVKVYPEFNQAYTRAKELQLEHIKNLANMGIFNSNFAQFTMVNISDWRIKSNVDISGKVDSQIFFAQMLEQANEALSNERRVMNQN